MKMMTKGVNDALVGLVRFGRDEVVVDYEGKMSPFTQPKDIVMRTLRVGVKLGDSFS